MENLSKINKLIDDSSATLVGILIKRLENLQLPEGITLTIDQIKALYFQILRDTIYENSRFLKKLIKIELDTGQIIFRSPTTK